MITRYHRWRHVTRGRSVQADFDAAGAWLVRLQSATATDPAPVDLLTAVRPRLCDRFAHEAALGRVVAALDRIDGRLRRERAPRTVVHGDFWPGNVLVGGDGGVVGVIDWESAQPLGQPLRDVARFALSYSLYLDRHTRAGRRVAGHPGLRAGEWGEAVAYAIDGDGWFPRLVTTWAGSHLRRLGVRARCWRDVAVAGLAEIAAHADDAEFARAHFELVVRLTGCRPT
jgi:Phosphotransferase enzyme family